MLHIYAFAECHKEESSPRPQRAARQQPVGEPEADPVGEWNIPRESGLNFDQRWIGYTRARSHFIPISCQTGTSYLLFGFEYGHKQ